MHLRSNRPEVFCKKGILKTFAKFTGEHLCQSPFLNKVIKKGTLAQVFFCEICVIFKNAFFIEHFWWLLLTFTYMCGYGFIAKPTFLL